MLKKGIISSVLVGCIAVGPGFEISAAAVDTSRQIINNENAIISYVCDAVVDSRIDYYEIPEISGEIVSIEETENSYDVLVKVSYNTVIKAETPDDSPYIQGIKQAISELSDPADITKANTYLKIWTAEIANNHINKEIPHNDQFKLSIPKAYLTPTTSNQFALNNSALVNSKLYSRTQKLGAYTEEAAYIDEPMESYGLPNDSEVKENAYDAVMSIVDRKNLELPYAAGSAKAQELDRIAAAEYGGDKANTPNNPKYQHFSSDCANFVSQCYYEGGVQTDDTWYMYSQHWKFVGGSQGSVEGLADYMLRMNNVVFWVDGEYESRALAGSILYYQNQAHVGIITSNDGRNATYSAHTNDTVNANISSYHHKNCDYLVPCWDSVTGEWTPQ